MHFNKNKIKSNFNRFSSNYESLANLQKQVANHLFKISEKDIIKSTNIIDLGCGTGFLGQNIVNLSNFSEKTLFQLDISENMLKENKNIGKNIHNIVADIENLPNFKEPFDIAMSSLAFQWLNNLENTVKNISNILNKGYPLFFSTFIEGTLKELKESSKSGSSEVSVNNFISKDNLENSLRKISYNIEVEYKDYKVYYPNIMSLLKSMKDIGASYSTSKSRKYTLTKKDFDDLGVFYLKNFNNDGRLVSSWTVAYVKVIF